MKVQIICIILTSSIFLFGQSKSDISQIKKIAKSKGMTKEDVIKKLKKVDFQMNR